MADYDKFQLRFTGDMRERLEEAARKNDRSLHQEIMERLRASLESPPLEARVAALEAVVLKKGK
jgi:hypothetical protein